MTVVLLLAAAGLTAAAHHRLPHDLRAERGEAYIPQPHFAKAMALGFDAVLADYYWVQAVLVTGGSLQPQTESTTLGRMIDVVTTLDPWVDHPYRFAAIWLTESLADVELANDLLRRSFPYHPDEWRNRFYLGFNLFMYLEEYEAAADVLEEASSMPDSPPYLPRLVARLRAEGQSLAAAALFLEEMVRTAEDETAKAGYQAALDQVEVEWRARRLDAARDRYREIHGRDIEQVEQLVAGSDALLPELPDPIPSSVPAPLRRESRWVIDAESGRIVSSYYGRRYRLHVDETERMRPHRRDARRAALTGPGDESDGQ